MAEETPIRIRGGAGPAEAAAITAAIHHVLDVEAATVASPPGRPRLSRWVRSGLRQPLPGPIITHTQATRRAAEEV